jgi:RIO-like serine/threonine protein kinase
MRALGRRDLPATIVAGGVVYRHERTHKHDFWAATGFYVSDAGHRVVLKMSRTEDFAGFPLAWVGRWLCRREMRFYNKLSDLPNVPPVLGTVGQTGFVHAYVEGRPLSRDRPVPDGFFDKLVALLRELHRRGIAYVDTNKPENILLGDDGLPHLIDFQISYDLQELGNTWLNRKLRQLQREDLYHILKHKKRLRPDEMAPEELAAAERKSWLIRLHRLITRPYFLLRRRTFKRLRQAGRLLPEGSK